ncbi:MULTISPECIES: alpha/beta fold hydrolase [Rheinheimera]|uniref:Alpha/beta fold hydrolase n=1 Tax=Rheinheimera marina TaxID=1774958 RepID=A0ABV9JQU5_9GAMM
MLLVILPGLDGSGLLYQRFAAALPQDWQVQCFSYPDSPLSYAELADWLEPQLPDQPFLLLGESFGGPLAYELARRQPQRVLGLVLCCTFIENPMPWAPVLWHWLRKLEFTAARRMVLLRYLLWGHEVPGLRAELDQALSMLPQASFIYRVEQVLALKAPTARSELTMPVLYLQAAQDKLVYAHCAQAFQQLLPQLQLFKFQCSHFLLQQQAEKGAEVLLHWCRQHRLRDVVQPEHSAETTSYPDSISGRA